ncbi:MAG: hypothetical protein ABIO29_05815 [Sphingomicrobium sp.]
MTWLYVSAALMAATAATHSILGERRLIGPMLSARSGVLRRDFARTIIRYAWHVTSVLMVASAITILWPATPRALVQIIGAIWLALGMTSLVVSRGKHVGWPVLSLAGIAALIGGSPS